MKSLFEDWRTHILTERYSVETSLAALKYDNKKMYNAYKKFIQDTHNKSNPYAPIGNIESKIRRASALYMTYILDLIPEDIYGPNAQSQEQKKKEADKNQGLAIMWVRKLSMKNSDLMNAIIQGDVSDYRGEWGDVMPDLEVYFQNLDLMPKKNLIELESFEELHDIVEKAKPEIEARQEKKQYLDAEEGTEVLRDDDELYIAVIHNKGAACELGKGTDWCTAAPGLDYFGDYYEPNDPLFFFKLKTSGKRYQFHYGSEQFMDERDRPIAFNDGSDSIFRYLHNQLIQTDAMEEYSTLRRYHYLLIAGDSDTPAETLARIVDDMIEERESDEQQQWTTSILEKVAANAKTPLAALHKLFDSTDNSWLMRDIQTNPAIDVELAKKIFLMNMGDPLIMSRGRKQMEKFAKWGKISPQEAQRLIDLSYDAPLRKTMQRSEPKAATLQENKRAVENWQLFLENRGPGDFLYDIKTSSTKITIKLLDPSTKEPVKSKKEGSDAYIAIEKRTDVPHWEVAWASSPAESEKVGTIMYLMALELADEGLSPDSYETSDDALRVWAKFMKNNEWGVEKEKKEEFAYENDKNPFFFVFSGPKESILAKYSDNITNIGTEPEKKPDTEQFRDERGVSNTELEDILASYEEGDFF